MKQPSVYLKMRVLGDIDTVQEKPATNASAMLPP